MKPSCKWLCREGPLKKFIQISWRNKRKIESPQITAHILLKLPKRNGSNRLVFRPEFQFSCLNGYALEPKGVPGFLAVCGNLLRAPLCYKLPMALENACYFIIVTQNPVNLL